MGLDWILFVNGMDGKGEPMKCISGLVQKQSCLMDSRSGRERQRDWSVSRFSTGWITHDIEYI
jgi:hypothetical protein